LSFLRVQAQGVALTAITLALSLAASRALALKHLGAWFFVPWAKTL
jgi:hypothetical protein